jgi:SSS family solute:Na+ symporter
LGFSFIDFVILFFYLAFMALMGIYFSRKNQSTEEYFVGGRSFPGWAIGLSMVGTSISSVTFLAYPADTFKTSWIRFVPNIVMPLGVVIATYYFLPIFRKEKSFSAYEYLEKRFGTSIRCYASVVFILAQVIRIGVVLYLIALLFHELIGLSPEMCILIAGVCVSLYTILGGIDAVIWTDVIQTVVLALGGAICLFVIIDKLPGGLTQIFEVAANADKFSFSELKNGQLEHIGWGLSLRDKTFTMLLLFGLTTWLAQYSSNQSVVQRYFAAKSNKEARKAMFITVLTSMPIWAFYMFLGTALYVFFQIFPDPQATNMLTGFSKSEQIFPYFIINYLPKGLTGLVVAAALAAAMSSLDSSINSISTVATMDIYKRYMVKNQPDRHYLRVGWCFATISAVVMILGALVLLKAETKTIQHTGLAIASVLGGGLLGIYMLGFFTKTKGVVCIWIGIVCTILFTLWAVLSGKGVLPVSISAPFEIYYTIILGNILMFIVGYVTSSFFKILLVQKVR